ncbi:Uncharacterised protein [Mycobacteroides abscessus subsp. abscessus]|nr:Uncharacterised protein [Mycobacteroides abscessus subsp. abscessus]SLC93872.1 Uncharacterised protein [Mycobacteroides abscessus subsp. massiliense]
METVVGQALGHIVHGDAGVLGDFPQIQNALMGHHAVVAGVEHWVVLVEAARQIVGRGDRRQRGRP